MLVRRLKMVEMRIVDNGLMCRPDFQYRYKLPENETYYDKNMKIVEWSYWETAPYVKYEEIGDE
jgi:hypothetical protein